MGRIVTSIVYVVYHVSCYFLNLVFILENKKYYSFISLYNPSFIICSPMSYMGRIVTSIVHVVYHVSSCDLMRLVCILEIQSCTARMAVCKPTIIICSPRSYMGRIVTSIVHVVYHVSSCALMRLVCILVIQSCTARMAVCKPTIIICARRSYMGHVVASIV